jgi:hypothetical protein
VGPIDRRKRQDLGDRESGMTIADSESMSLTTILIIVLIIAVLGGGGFYFGRR